MTMHLLIKTENTELQEKYIHHTNYHEGDSGLDLFCPNDILVKSGETVKIDLEIRCEALKDNRSNVSYYLYPRSSIVKTPLRLANSVGIIDAGYRGNIMAYVDNIKGEDYLIEKDTRLFQICSGDLSPVTFELVNDLSDTSRGEGGFGSTNDLNRTEGVDYTQSIEPEPEITNLPEIPL
jgi:dUTP pyrophosphatase